MAINKVLIIGAGPSGLLLGIMLANHGIQVQMLDMNTDLDTNPRAAHYAPSAVYDFTRAGIIDDVNAAGFHPGGVCWREIDGKFIAGMGRAWTGKKGDDDEPEAAEVPKGKYPMVVLPLDRLGKVFLKRFESYPNTEILWSHKVVDIDQDEKEARVIVETPEGKKTFGADYVIGADGASSQIRRSLFGEAYPGETLNAQIIATNVYYDFKKFGYWDSNFIVHPKDWYMAAKITTDGCWRVTYGDTPGLTREEYLERQPMRYEQILPGNPKPGDYKLVGASPYKLQQRCAPSFRVGRFILVADAAHLCNPFGGLGLTGGFADVGSLYDCLLGIHEGKADEDILDKYSEVRIKLWKDMIDPQSRANFRRLWDDSVIEDRNAFFAICEKASKDAEFAQQMNEGIHAIRHDMTQYYKNAPAVQNGA